MKPLTKEQFKTALEKGLGRAYLHVQEHGAGEYENILLDACLHNWVYDPQCEGERADWLYSMVELAGLQDRCENALLNILFELETTWDINQALELLKQFAIRGSERSKTALYKWFDASNHPETWLGGNQLIDVDGIDGFLYVAEKIGARLVADTDFCEDDFMLSDVKERFGENEVSSALHEKAASSRNIAEYIQRVTPIIRNNNVNKDNIAQRMREQFPLEKIMRDVEECNGNFPYQFASFGRHALDDEITIAFDRLIKESKDDRLQRLLWIFHRRALPELSQKIFDLTLGEKETLRNAAITALSHTSNSRIREFANDILSNRSWEKAVEGIPLLEMNYEASDGERLESILQKIPQNIDPDRAHNIVMDIVGVVGVNHTVADLENSLLWCYENSPCMYCRESVVRVLLENGLLSDELIQECKHDGSDGIRQLVKKGNPESK